MKKLIFTNSQGDSIEFSDAAPFILTKFDTSDNVTLYSHSSPDQDGRTYTENVLEQRESTIEILIEAQSRDHLAMCRSKINKILNPKNGEGYVTVFDGAVERRLNCIVDRLPYFVDVSPLYAECLISLESNDPFFKSVIESKEEIAVWRGAFEFPLEILEDGIEMGYREPSLIVNIENKGDVPCGMRIQFKALATLKNPSLFNVNTRDYFKINKQMEAGEIITVTTHFQNKRVELNKNGVISNAFNWIDFTSTFLQLDVGDNLFRYDADEGIDNLEVAIYYTPQYLGV